MAPAEQSRASRPSAEAGETRGPDALIRQILDQWPIVGRDELVDGIVDVIDTTRHGVLLVGGAGVGKTIVVDRLRERWSTRGPVTRITASASTASIPLSVFASVPLASDAEPEPLALFRTLVETFIADPEHLLLVDDAYLLDPPSAAVVQQAAAHIAVVLTTRPGSELPDALASLARAGSLRMVRARELDESTCGELVPRVLGGPVQDAALERLYTISLGNPLFLRELLLAGAESGALHRRAGMWSWGEDVLGGSRLGSLFADRLGTLDVSARRTLDLVAIGEPLPLAPVEHHAGRTVLAALERGRLVEIEEGAEPNQGATIRCAHPMVAESVRSDLGPAQRRAAAATLLDVIGTPGATSASRLRYATWCVEAGDREHPDLLLDAARSALGRGDLALAERLARAALDAGAALTAVTPVLSEILQDVGRHDEAAALLEAIDDDPSLAFRKAVNLYLGQGDRGVASDALDRAATAAASVEDRLNVDAARAWLMLFDGQTREAAAVSRSVLAPGQPLCTATVRAGLIAAVAGGFLGESEAALAHAELAARVAIDVGDAAGISEQEARQVGVWARCLHGDLIHARAEAEAGLREASRSARLGGSWAGFAGVAAFLQGHVRSSADLMRQSIAFFGDDDPYRFLRLCEAQLASALAMAGESEEAAAVDEASRRLDGEGNHLLDAWVTIQRAIVAGSLAGASAAALGLDAALVSARQTEQPFVELFVHFTRARTVDPVRAAKELERAPILATNPFMTACEQAIDSLASRSADRLVEASLAMESLGADLYAAELGFSAAAALRRAGRHPGTAAERAAALAERCEQAQTPLLRAEGVAVLTAREREVAFLAARGLASKEIGERLGISRRTVDNQLSAVYAKLGVSGRGELTELLGPSEQE